MTPALVVARQRQHAAAYRLREVDPVTFVKAVWLMIKDSVDLCDWRLVPAITEALADEYPADLATLALFSHVQRQALEIQFIARVPFERSRVRLASPERAAALTRYHLTGDRGLDIR